MACGIIRRPEWTSPVGAAAAALLRCYVPGLQLGCMRAPLRAAGEHDPYSTGGGCDAHAWAALMPCSLVKMLISSRNAQGPQLRLERYALTPWTRAALPVLSLDGTAVKEVYPRALPSANSLNAPRLAREWGSSGRVRGQTRGVLRKVLHESRALTTLKARSPDNDGTYVFLLQMLTLDGVVDATSGVAVRDLHYATGDRYGARYADAFRAILHRVRARSFYESPQAPH